MSEFRKRLEVFLKGNSRIEQLTPDASMREYFRVEWREKTAIACVYPQDAQGKNQFAACLDVTEVFLSEKLPVAEIFAADEEKGIVIHEDFGNLILRDVLLKTDDQMREKLLDAAIELIAKIQAATVKAFDKKSIASRLRFDEEKLLWELSFFRQHYFSSLKNQPLSAEEDLELTDEFRRLCKKLESRARVLCHRDFHAANLMIQNDELKIIDYQDARIGTTSYDLVSLLLDRVTAPPTPKYLAEKRALLIKARVDLNLETLNEKDFDEEFRLQAVQRCLKAIGTFSYQSTFRGKTNFVQFIKPMFEIVLRAGENLGDFPKLQQIIRRELHP